MDRTALASPAARRRPCLGRSPCRLRAGGSAISPVEQDARRSSAARARSRRSPRSRRASRCRSRAAYSPRYGARLCAPRMPIYRPADLHGPARRVQQRRLADRPQPARRALEPGFGGGVGGVRRSSPLRCASATSIAKLEAVNGYVNRARPLHRRQRPVRTSPTAGPPPPKRCAAAAAIARIIAIAKRSMLRARRRCRQGPVPGRPARISLRRADHAVLVVRAEGRFLVLDNGTDRIVDSSEMPRLSADLDLLRQPAPAPTAIAARLPPVIYRRQRVESPCWPKPVEPHRRRRAAVAPSRQPVGHDRSDQRSRSASLRAFSTGFSR